MPVRRVAIFALMWLACGNLTPALAQAPQAEARIALLIGNSAYARSPLANAVNDVRLMEGALRRAGFHVIKGEDATRRDMRRLIRDFGERLRRSGGVGLFYFAGHGVQVRGVNYLVPVDADIRAEDEVAYDAVDAQSVLDKMESARNRVNLLILDACRDNPFSRSRSTSAGLATMTAPSGSLVAYATAPGSVASDGAGSNGLYTRHLASTLLSPGLPLEEVFKQVRSAVRRDSNGQQTPWENTALEGQFYFVPPQGVAPPEAPAIAAAPLATPTMATPVAPPVAVPAPSAPGPTVDKVFVLRDHLTGIEREVALVEQRGADGTVVWSTGDEIASDGTARVARIGTLLVKAVTGSLWTFPLKPGASGSATLTGSGSPGRGEIAWRVTGSAQDPQIEARVVFELGVQNSANFPMRGRWTATYTNGLPVPVRFTTELRGTTYSGTDLSQGEVRAAKR